MVTQSDVDNLDDQDHDEALGSQNQLMREMGDEQDQFFARDRAGSVPLKLGGYHTNPLYG